MNEQVIYGVGWRLFVSNIFHDWIVGDNRQCVAISDEERTISAIAGWRKRLSFFAQSVLDSDTMPGAFAGIAALLPVSARQFSQRAMERDRFGLGDEVWNVAR